MKSIHFFFAFLLAAMFGGKLSAQCSLDLGPDQTLTCISPQASITATMTGTGPFTLMWPGVAPIETPNNTLVLPFAGGQPGTYCVTMTDATGCSATDCLVVTSNVVAPSCDINASAWDCLTSTMTLFGSSTSPGAVFQWSGPNNFSGSQQSAVVLTAGTYTLVVTTPNGCTSTCLANVTPGGPLFIASNITQPSCNGPNSGVVSVAFSGGTPPYSYLWTGPNGFTSTTAVIGNLAAGVYTVVVTDAGGCSATQAITLAAPTPILTNISAQATGCNAAQLTATGNSGGAVLVYSWSPGVSPSNISNPTVSQNGDYCVTLTNSAGCTALGCITVNLPGDSCSKIYGNVRFDTSANCLFEAGEMGLEGWSVAATDGSGAAFYGLSDSSGRYEIFAYPGSYVVHATAPSAVWAFCQNDVSVALQNAGDSVAVNFLAQGPALCPQLFVDISTNRLRRCFDNNFYSVYYQNRGTAIAEDVVVTVTLDADLSIVSASKPYTIGASGELIFSVGDLDVNESGWISIQVFVACIGTVLGETHCTEAKIDFSNPCPMIPETAGLNLNHECGATDLTFEISANDIPQTYEYVVIEDAVMREVGVDTVFPGQPHLFDFPKNGSTWRLEATPTAPTGMDIFKVFRSIEGCGASNPAGAFSTGFVNQFVQNPYSESVDLDCTANTGSYDPNDKIARPEGFGAKHYLKENTEIEYVIRFQNTGTDTAFNIVVRDTLAAEFDPATFRAGAASHLFEAQIGGAGILIFTFKNILLVDSFKNEPLSHGFVSFSIKMRDGLALETRLENRAAIFFDFNDPIITNTVFHTVGEDFIPSSIRFFDLPKGKITASPNPFSDATMLDFEGFSFENALFLTVFDSNGQLLRIEKVVAPRHVFEQKGLPSGLHFLLLEDEKGQPIGRGKLAVH